MLVLRRSRPTDEQDRVAPPAATQAQRVPNLLNSCLKPTPQLFQRKPKGMKASLQVQQFELRAIAVLTRTVLQAERTPGFRLWRGSQPPFQRGDSTSQSTSGLLKYGSRSTAEFLGSTGYAVLMLDIVFGEESPEWETRC